MVNYYVKHKLDSYIDERLVREDLGEATFADFEGWEESDFKRVGSRLLGDLRNHLRFNGIMIEKREGLQISRALSSVIATAESKPYCEGKLSFSPATTLNRSRHSPTGGSTEMRVSTLMSRTHNYIRGRIDKDVHLAPSHRLLLENSTRSIGFTKRSAHGMKLLTRD